MGSSAGLPRLYASFGVSRFGGGLLLHRRQADVALLRRWWHRELGRDPRSRLRISRLFRNPEFREAILQAPDAGRVYALIAEGEDARETWSSDRSTTCSWRR